MDLDFTIKQWRKSVLGNSVALKISQTDAQLFEIMEAVNHFRIKFLSDFKTVRYQRLKQDNDDAIAKPAMIQIDESEPNKASKREREDLVCFADNVSKRPARPRRQDGYDVFEFSRRIKANPVMKTRQDKYLRMREDERKAFDAQLKDHSYHEDTMPTGDELNNKTTSRETEGDLPAQRATDRQREPYYLSF